MKLLTCSIILLNAFVNSSVKNNTITDFSKCKVHYSRSETSYTKFYQITDKFRANNSLLFDFHFSVLAPRDAHILLAPSVTIHPMDPVYEIVLGAGANTFSDIRRQQKSGVKRSASTKNLLSTLDVRSFWIHISKDGIIEIGKEGNELAFLSWRDSDPLPIEVFSFCTWPGVEAKWYYDCPREDGSISSSKEIEKELTTTDKIRKQILNNYDPYGRPIINPQEAIVIHLVYTAYNRIRLDEKECRLTIHGVMQFNWFDERLQWNASEFDNVNRLHFNFREIWLPSIYIYNGVHGPANDFLKSTNAVLTSNGLVTWYTQMHAEAWCDASGLGHWPDDVHLCGIELGFLSYEKDMVFTTYPNITHVTADTSEWTVIDITSNLDLIPTPWNGEESKYGTTFAILFTLKRTSDFYTRVYFVIITGIAVSVLVSFLLPLNGPFRIGIYCFQLILLTLCLTRLGLTIPAHPTSVPTIVALYSYGFIVSLTALIFTVALRNLGYSKHTKPLPFLVQRLLSLDYVQTFLYVRNSKFSDSYDNLIDDAPPKDDDIQKMWKLLSIAIDRILFLIYFLIVTISLFKSY